MSKDIRTVAHNFAIGYRVESRETRNEDIDIFLKALSTIVLALKKPTPEIISIECIEKLGVEEAALLLHRRSEILGHNACCEKLSQLILGENK